MNAMDSFFCEGYDMSNVPLHEPVKAINDTNDLQAFRSAPKHSRFDHTVNAWCRAPSNENAYFF